MAGSNYSSRLAFFMAGAAVGGILGLLFAPKPGRETREYLAGKAGEGRDYLTGKTRQLHRQASDMMDRGKYFVAKQKDRLAEALKES